ncbi:MAG: endonuclease [Paludibacteraceae bacterium]|nr:endonuclease [Paludibacteraceae bacterium]
MKRFVLALLTIVCGCVFVCAEPVKVGYYDRIDGKADEDLKDVLRAIIRPHTAIPYGSGANSTWEVFYYSDRDTVTGKCMDMYCDDWKVLSSPGQVAAGCNIEHSFAKSWWGGSKNDAYKDCYHLNPSNSTANSSRGNYPLGVPTRDVKYAGSLTVGKCCPTGYSEYFDVFMPKDEYKGDFARAYFYMATCYGNELTWRMDNEGVGSYYAMDNDSYLEFKQWEIDVLLAWHRQDPVSSKELQRINAVSDFQHNRNPFIDYPELVEFIWGNKQGKQVDIQQLKFTGDSTLLPDTSGTHHEEVEFELLQPIDISALGFTANWQAPEEMDCFTLDVFTKTTSATESDTILNVDLVSKTSPHIMFSGKTYNDEKGIRLGTTKGEGTLTITGLSIGAEAVLTIKAYAYRADENLLRVSADGEELEIIELSTSGTEANIEIPTGVKQIVLSQATAGKRVIISAITLVSGGVKEHTTSLSGYPVEVDGTAYTVELAEHIDTLYYSVTPCGTSETLSDWVELPMPEDVSLTEIVPTCEKVLRRGQLFILRGGKYYSIAGQVVDMDKF